MAVFARINSFPAVAAAKQDEGATRVSGVLPAPERVPINQPTAQSNNFQGSADDGTGPGENEFVPVLGYAASGHHQSADPGAVHEGQLRQVDNHRRTGDARQPICQTLGGPHVQFASKRDQVDPPNLRCLSGKRYCHRSHLLVGLEEAAWSNPPVWEAYSLEHKRQDD